MNAMAELMVLAEPEEFLAPVGMGNTASLLAQYRKAKERIEEVASFLVSQRPIKPHDSLEEGGLATSVETELHEPWTARLFEANNAVAELNAMYWGKWLHLSNLWDTLPMAERKSWEQSIARQTCPPFNENSLQNVWNNSPKLREPFLAERLIQVYESLIGESPAMTDWAFSRRISVPDVLCNQQIEDANKCQLINDLRCVVSRFMGCEEPDLESVVDLLELLKTRWGEWVSIDGGSLQLRLYKMGLAHIKVHPDLAWRLNTLLEYIYPGKIALALCQRPKRRPQKFAMIHKPMPLAVRRICTGSATVTGVAMHSGPPSLLRARLEVSQTHLQFHAHAPPHTVGVGAL